jgi:hypothetical protein
VADLTKAAGLKRYPHEGLVDDGGGAAALGDEYFSGGHGLFLSVAGMNGELCLRCGPNFTGAARRAAFRVHR